MLGISTQLLASTDFNEHPIPLHIHGTRESNSGLFSKLNQAETLQQAGNHFQD